MGLAPSGLAHFPADLNGCEVPVPIFSQPLRERTRPFAEKGDDATVIDGTMLNGKRKDCHE